jgi:hypothetical protein
VPVCPTQFHSPPCVHHAHRALTPPPTAPACHHPRSKEACSSALGGGCRPRPLSEEDVGRCRWPAHAQRRTARTRRTTSVATHACAQRRTSVAAADRSALGGGLPTLRGGRRSPPPPHPRSEEDRSPLAATGLSSPAASRAAHHCCLIATAARSSGHPPL